MFILLSIYSMESHEIGLHVHQQNFSFDFKLDSDSISSLLSIPRINQKQRRKNHFMRKLHKSINIQDINNENWTKEKLFFAQIIDSMISIKRFIKVLMTYHESTKCLHNRCFNYQVIFVGTTKIFKISLTDSTFKLWLISIEKCVICNNYVKTSLFEFP